MKRLFSDRVVGAIWLICGTIMTNFSVEVYTEWAAVWYIGLFVTISGLAMIVGEDGLFGTDSN